jgi:hypothetical protein
MKKLLILSLFLACTLSVLKAQETPNNYTIEDKPSMNFIKLSLTTLPFKDFSLQYERVLSRRISAAASFSIMPERNIPFVDQVIKMAEFDDPEAEDIIRDLLISSYTVTPEVRFYLGKKGYSTGFYLSLFYRYGHYEASNAAIPYTNDEDEDITINTGGSITSHTGGFLMGYQWALGKHMCLDWQMFGPHFGVSSGDFLGVPSTPLAAIDQADIEENFMKVESTLIKQTVDATADEVKMITDGPWAGLRFSLSIGVKF